MRGHAVALLLLACISQTGDGECERLGEREGIVIERRSVGHSSIRELRLTARSPLPPAALMATLWRHDCFRPLELVPIRVPTSDLVSAIAMRARGELGAASVTVSGEANEIVSADVAHLTRAMSGI